MEEEFVYEEGVINGEFYSDDGINELSDDDEIDLLEAGFMSGYLNG